MVEEGIGLKCPQCTKPLVELPWGFFPLYGCLECRLRVEVFPLTESDMKLVEKAVLICCSCGKEVRPGESCRCTRLAKEEAERIDHEVNHG